MPTSRSILVSGGGIAGLTAALALSKRGYRVEVCEKAPGFDVIGAGIQLSPNALRILDELGAGRAIRRLASAPDGIRMRSSLSNHIVKTIPLGSHAIGQFGLPYLCLHRAELHQALLSTCQTDPDITISMHSDVSDATVHPNGVSALVLKRGEMQTRRGRALIVADGVRSGLRDQVPDQGKIRHSGFEAWRAMIPAARLPAWLDMDYTHLIMGHNAHAVLYPVNSRRYLNVVICIKTRSTKTEVIHGANRDHLLKRLRWWSSRLKALFEEADTWSLWPILERRKTCLWNGGPVAFIGDAAHAMPPFAAQGAALAIEDAAVLAASMERCGVGPRAMEEFADLRIGRVEKMRKLARANGSVYHMGWPFSFVRNIGMAFIPAKSLLSRQSWVYDWRMDG